MSEATAADPRLDPEMAAALALMARETAGLGDRYAEEVPIAEGRRIMERERAYWNADAPEVAEVRDLALDGPGGAGDPVPVRVFYPTAGRDAAVPTILFLHGGGWAMGSLGTHNKIMRLLALGCGAAVVGVDYDLAPEHPFPRAFEQSLAVARGLAARGDVAADWGLDAGRLAICGDSAGANLGLATALALRDEVPVAALALAYGCYAADFETESYRTLGGGEFGLGREGMMRYWRMYAPDPAFWRDPRCAPLLADPAGLPPTFLPAAALDPLRDDSHALAARLAAAGVPHEVRIYDGVVHGFLHMTRGVATARRAVDDICRFLRRHLDGGG